MCISIISRSLLEKNLCLTSQLLLLLVKLLFSLVYLTQIWQMTKAVRNILYAVDTKDSHNVEGQELQ